MITLLRLKYILKEAVLEFLLFKMLAALMMLAKFPKSYIHLTATIRNSKLHPFSSVHSDATVRHSEIGSFTYIGPRTIVSNCHIGKGCSIAPGVVIGIATHRNEDGRSSSLPNVAKNLNNGEYGPLFELAHAEFHENNKNIGQIGHFEANERKVTIGDFVYIGQNTLISEGITIGSNVIIGCNSFVNKDVEDNKVVVGSPAVEVRNVES